MRRLFAMILAVVFLIVMPRTAQAHDVPQDRNDCSIEVTVRFDGENVTGGTLTAIKVGYVAQEDGNYAFYQELTGTKLEDVTSASAVSSLKSFYENNKNYFYFYIQTQSVVDGKAVFTGLPTGLYLIVQNQPADGFNKLGSFLIGVPYMEDGEYRYHVASVSKPELEREPGPESTETMPTKPKDPQLPQTGQLNWPMPLLTVGGMALVTLGFFLRHERKETHET